MTTYDDKHSPDGTLVNLFGSSFVVILIQADFQNKPTDLHEVSARYFCIGRIYHPSTSPAAGATTRNTSACINNKKHNQQG